MPPKEVALIMHKYIDWNSLFDEHSNSGLTAKEFCLKNNINYSTFINKKSRMKKNDENVNYFLPVVCSNHEDKISFSIDGHLFEFDSNVDDHLITRVVGAFR